MSAPVQLDFSTFKPLKQKTFSGPPPAASAAQPTKKPVTLDFKTFTPLEKSSTAPLPNYARLGPYKTALKPDEERAFQSWVKQNRIPWQDAPNADYDMRGYYRAMKSGDPRARQATNRHFPDTWKTPYHKSFSAESRYATPDASHWKGNQLVDKTGAVVFDESKPQTAGGSAVPAKTVTDPRLEKVAQATNPVLQQVLNEYPGLSKNFNADNTYVVFASGERAQRGVKERGGLEFWNPEGESPADPTFLTPRLGKNILEIYSDDLKNNPSELKQAITGDLLHGMSSDPYWKGLRNQFMQNFTPQELKRQNEHESWWEDVNNSPYYKDRNEGIYDAYLRGWIFNEGDGKAGQKESKNTMYSPRQIQILQKMQDYLKTGKYVTGEPTAPSRKSSALRPNWRLGIPPETPLPYQKTPLPPLATGFKPPRVTPAAQIRLASEEALNRQGASEYELRRTTPEPTTFGELFAETQAGGARRQLTGAGARLAEIAPPPAIAIEKISKEDEKLLRTKEAAKQAVRNRVEVYRGKNPVTSPIARDERREAFQLETLINNAQSQDQVEKLMRLDEADRAGDLQYAFQRIVEANHEPLFTAEALPPEAVDGVALGMSMELGFPVSRGIAKGTINSLGSLLTPENIELMAVLPEAKGLSGAGITGVFAYQGLKGASEQLNAAHTAWKAGNTEEAQEEVVEGLVSALVGGAASLHVASKTIPAVRRFLTDPLRAVLPTDEAKVTEYIQQQAETRAMEAGAPAQAIETTEANRRGAERRAAKAAERPQTELQPPPAPVETPFAAKLKAALELPEKADAAPKPATDAALERVAEEVRKAAEKSKAPTLEDVVRAYAEKVQPEVPDPHLVAQDIRGKRPQDRTDEEKDFLDNYGLWKSLPLALDEEKMRQEATELQRHAEHASSPGEADFYASQAVNAQEDAERAQTLLDEEKAKRRTDMAETTGLPPSDEIYTREGKATTVSIPGRDTPLKAHYAAVRLAKIVASHDSHSWQWNPNYWKPLQPRDLNLDLDAQYETQEASKAGKFIVDRLLNPGDTAELGPPILLKNGMVAGGNRRLLMLKLALESGDTEKIVEALRAGSVKFGIPLSEGGPLELENPWVVVRILDDMPEDMTQIAVLGQDLNRGFIQGFTPDAKAVANGARLELPDMEQIAHWIDTLPGEEAAQSLSKLMNTYPQQIFDLMLRKGVVEGNRRAEYMVNGNLTPEAKIAFERSILGKVIDDPEILALSEQAVKNKVTNALVPLVEIRSGEQNWNITDYLKKAMGLQIEIERVRDSFDHIGKKSDSLVEKYLAPENFEGGTPLIFSDQRAMPHPITKALAKLLELSGLRVKRALEAYAREMEGDMFGKSVAVDAFNRHIGKETGVEVHPLEWGTLTPATEAAKAVYDEAEKPHLAPREQAEELQHANLPEPAAAELRAVGKLQATVEAGTVTPESLQKFFAARRNLRDWAKPLMKIFGEIVPRGTGQTLPEFLKKAFTEVRRGEAAGNEIGAKGTYDWAQRVMEIYENADAVTAAHEFIHGMRHFLKASDESRLRNFVHDVLRKVRDKDERPVWSEEKLAALRKGEWTPEEDEILARAWEQYLTEGEAPREDLQDIFTRLKTIFKKTYQALTTWEKQTGVKIEVTPEAREVFDGWFGKETRAMEAAPAAEMTAPPEPIEEAWKPGEEEFAKLAIESDPAINEASGPRYAIRFDAGEGNPFTRAQDWANLNSENLLGFQAWQTIDGNVVAEYVPVTGEKLYQKMSREEIEREFGELTPPPEAQIAPPPGVPERVEVKGGQHGEEAVIEGRVPDEDIGVRQPARTGGVAEPAGRPTSGNAVAAGVPGGRPGAGKRGEPAPLRVVLAGANKVENAAPVREPEPAKTSLTQWVAQMIRYRIPENLPMPTRFLSGMVARVLRFAGQHELGDAMYSALQQHDGVINASPTGTGKTYTSLAVARQMQLDGTGKQILIVAPNRERLDAPDGWKAVGKDSFGMTIDELPEHSNQLAAEGAYAMTYAVLREHPWAWKQKWDLVIMDESQAARRWYESKQGSAARSLSDSAKKAIYVSATPFHTALEYGYMTKLGLWGEHSEKVPDFESWARQFGARKKVTERTVWANGKRRTVQEEEWVRQGMAPKRLMKEREELIERGQFVTQEKSMEGYEAQVAMAPVTPEMLTEIANIGKAFEQAQRFYTSQNKPELAMAARRNGATFMKMYLERKKLEPIIELMRQAHDQGWQAVLYSETNKERTELYDFLKEANQALKADGSEGLEALIPNLPGVVETLKEKLGAEDVGDYSGGYSRRRQEALKKWRAGETPYLYASYGAAGEGVSMHDTSAGGVRPVAAFYLGPAYSGIVNEQRLGRPWRYGTTSNVFAVHMMSNAAPEVDMMLTKIVPRMESLKAAVSGILDDKLANAMKRIPEVRTTTAGFDLGSEVNYDPARFMKTVTDLPVVNYKEVKIPSAEEAKGKGMQYPGARKDAAQSPERFLSVEESKAVIQAHEMMQALVEGEPMPVLGDGLKDWSRSERQALADVITPSVQEAIATASEEEKTGAAQAAIRIGMKEVLAAGRVGDVKLTPEGERMVWEMTAPGEVGDAEDVKEAKQMGIASQILNFFHRSGGMAIEAMGRRAGVPEIGRLIRRKKDLYVTDWQTIKAEYQWRYKKILADNKITDSEHEQMVMAKEGRIPAPNERIARATQQITALFNEAERKLAEKGVYFEDRDEAGDVEKIFHADALENPNYWPHQWDHKAKISLKDPVTGEEQTVTLKQLLGNDLRGLRRERIIEALMAKMGKSRYEVEDFLARRKGRLKKAGNIERARKADLQLYRLDKGVALNYFDQFAEVLARTEHFGQNGEKLDGLLAKIPQEQPRAVIREIMDTILRPQPWSKSQGRFFGLATTAQMLTKMPFSVGKIWAHSVQTGVVMGSYRPLIRGILKGVTSPREVYRLAKFCGAIQDQAIADSDLARAPWGRVAHWYMNLTGSEPVYKMQRMILNAGIQQAMERDFLPALMKKAKSAEYLRRQLREIMLLDDEQIDRAIKMGRWSEEDLNRASTAAVNKILFNARDLTQLPPVLRARGGEIGGLLATAVRPAYIMGSFQFKTAMLLREGLINETRRGNLRPLMHFVTAYPVTGLLMSLGTAGLQTAFQTTLYSLFPSLQPEGYKSPLETREGQLKDLIENPTWRGWVHEYAIDLADAGAMGWLRQITNTFYVLTSGNTRQALYKLGKVEEDELESTFGPMYSDIVKTGVDAVFAAGYEIIYSGEENAEKREQKEAQVRRHWIREESPAARLLVPPKAMAPPSY